MPKAKKSLGQHWLNDFRTLETICDAADVGHGDTVLEIGPGKGSLTAHLLMRGAKAIAVEIDTHLATTLQKNISHHISSNFKDRPCNGVLEVVEGDILEFDLGRMPAGYKVVANIPYYLTGKILRQLSESANPPEKIVFLVQKEVAKRVAAKPGQMSLLAVSTQLYYEPKLGNIVAAELFNPKPKVDSQVVILTKRSQNLLSRTVLESDKRKFFRVVRAGFSSKRKKLRSSLSAGLGVEKNETDQLLKKAGINGELRAQSLSLDDWQRLYELAVKQKML